MRSADESAVLEGACDGLACGSKEVAAAVCCCEGCAGLLAVALAGPCALEAGADAEVLPEEG